VKHWVGHGEAGHTASKRLGKGRLLFIGLTVLVVVAVLGYFGMRRPRLQVSANTSGIHLTNEGASVAEVFRVDTFWYWESKVGYLTDMPDVVEQVPPANEHADSQGTVIPDIPSPTAVCGELAPCFMRMVIHYDAPHIPIFRYRAIAYFRFDQFGQEWRVVDNMPARYRSLGNLGRGDVEMINAWQH